MKFLEGKFGCMTGSRLHDLVGGLRGGQSNTICLLQHEVTCTLACAVK